MHLFRIFYLFTIITLFFLRADEVKAKVEEDDFNHSASPILTYDSTYKLVLGGALFVESERPKGYNLDGQLYANRNKNFGLDLDFNYFFTQNYNTELSSTITNFFEPYYGEGIDTNKKNRVKIDQDRFLFKSKIFYNITEEISLGSYFDFRKRHEVAVNSIGDKRMFPDDRALALGLIIADDERDNIKTQPEGISGELTYHYVPKHLNSVSEAKDFSQIEGFLKYYKPILKSIIVSNASSGISFGHPNYDYKYSLGGMQGLRGYETNRFRGDKIIFLQVEERYPFYKDLIYGALFYEIGSVTDDKFTSAKDSKGFGMRINLPPDYIAKVRLDIAFGRDQKNITLDFNENF